MTEQLVVCFRCPDSPTEPAEHLVASRALVERATESGGRLVGWGAASFTFAFDPERSRDALELSVELVREAAAGREYAAGVSEGALESAVAAGSVELSWGPALVCAEALARAAQPGEVVIDPELGAARRSELTTGGLRVGIHGKLRLRGVLLDVKQPFRTGRPAAKPSMAGPLPPPPAGVVTPPVEPGVLTIVRAARGEGGTLFLSAIERALEPARVLNLAPHPLGEPFGPIRRAMLRAVTMGQSPLNLDANAGHSLDALLGGEGLDPSSCAELIAAWLTPDAADAPRGAVLLDDAGEMDADTLDAIAQANEAQPFRIVARLGLGEPVPSGLADLRRGATAMVPTPAIGAVTREAVRARLLELPADARHFLEAVAALGGQAEEGELAELLRLRPERVSEPDAARAALFTEGWLRRIKPDVLALPGATHRDVIVAALEDLDFQEWHAAAARMLSRRERPLASAPAAVHAILSGDVERASELARHAAGATRAMGLEATAEAFGRFEMVQDPSLLVDRRLFTPQLDEARSLASERPGARPSASPGVAVVSRAPASPPASVGGGADQGATPDVEPAEAVSVGPARGDAATDEAPPPPPPPASEVAEARPRRVSEPPQVAVDALRKGDLEAVDRVATHLREDAGRTGLADRLQAMSQLARGATGDAIRKLREAADEAKRTGSRDRCRTGLALGVALAAGGRQEEALLVVLDALARARELDDGRGERACARFLAHLSETVGHHDVAAAWATLAEA